MKDLNVRPEAIKLLKENIGNILFFSCPCCVACRILGPWTGIEPVPPAAEVWSLNHWTTWEVLVFFDNDLENCFPGACQRTQCQKELLLGSPQFSCSVMSDSSQPHGLQHTRLPCPSPTPRVCSNLCPLNIFHKIYSS